MTSFTFVSLSSLLFLFCGRHECSDQLFNTQIAMSPQSPLLGVCRIHNSPWWDYFSNDITMNKNATAKSCSWQSDYNCGCQGSHCKFIDNLVSSTPPKVVPHRECQTEGSLLIKDKDEIIPGSELPPFFISSLTDGEKPSPLVCNVCGNPAPSITWYALKGIPSEAKCVKDEKGFSNLILPSFNLSVASNSYVCLAENEEGRALLGIWNFKVVPRLPRSTLVPSTQELHPSEKEDERSLTTKQLVGIVCATGGFYCLAVVIALLLWGKRKRQKRNTGMVYRLNDKVLDPDQCDNPTVYISHAALSDEQARPVRALAYTLISQHGINVRMFDLHKDEAADASMPAWILAEVTKAHAIIVICCKDYKDIASAPDLTSDDGREDLLRIKAEWHHLQARVYAEGKNCCVPLFIEPGDPTWLPLPLQSADPLQWPDDENRLVRRLRKRAL